MLLSNKSLVVFSFDTHTYTSKRVENGGYGLCNPNSSQPIEIIIHFVVVASGFREVAITGATSLEGNRWYKTCDLFSKPVSLIDCA